jgi:septum formation protein
MVKIVLASQSHDRKKMLKNLKIPFEIVVPSINEDSFKYKILDPYELVKNLAKAKALAVKEMLSKTSEEIIIIAADTIVQCDGEIIGKALDENQATNFLKKLSNRPHKLITGFAIAQLSKEIIITDFDCSIVKFADLSEEEIKLYVNSGEWKGRAGAYSIYDKASLLIENIDGSPSNVIGLPLRKIYRILKDIFKINLLNIGDDIIG